MDFLFESTDFDKVKLSIYEQCSDGKITDEQKQTLMEAVAIKEINENLITEAALIDMASMTQVLGIVAGAIAAAGAITLIVMKVISALKTRDKIKASTELTAINNDIKKCRNDLAKMRAEMQQIINEYRSEISDAETRANFYGSRWTQQNSIQHNYNTGYTDVVRTTQYNPQYDKRKSDMEKRRADNLRKTVHKYVEKRDQIEKEMSNLSKLKSKFLAVVRTNMEAQEYENIRNELDRIMANVEGKKISTGVSKVTAGLGM